LHERHEQVLRRLFPFFPFDKKPVKFPIVQQQSNCNDCGVFAIAFATSLVFNIKPDKVKYDVNLMRLHLIKMLESNVIEHFPQDLKCNMFQKVLPLAVVRAKEAEALCLRIKRQCEKKQSQKFNQQKICNSQESSDINYINDITNDINFEQSNKFQSESCVEDIDCCKININYDLCNNEVKNNIQICDTNKDVGNECANKHLQHDFKVNRSKVKRLQEMTLSSEQKSIIVQGRWLNDLHMDHFNYLLERYSDFRPVGTWRVQAIHRVQPVSINKKHIQILPERELGIHWTCCYYDTNNIFVYDSLNTKMLSMCQKQFLEKLFPTYDFIKYPVQFPVVQEQQNGSDCGVFAIAFAVSLLFNIKPENVRYDVSLMRPHLIKILESNVIEHFPQNSKYAPLKNLSLKVIRSEKIKAIDTNCQYEKEQQNQFQENYNSQQIEKKCNNDFF